MCGIVGYVSGKNKTEYEKFFKQALIADVLRGLDSTGVIIGKPSGVEYYKKAVNGIDFLDMKPATTLINSAPLNRPAFMIGHNRAATVGNVVSANAHPFQHGDITGVHNGTLRQFHKLEKDRDFGTDSEALYYNLSKRGVEETLSDVKGAYALVWYDNSDGSVNIIRNDERPLWIGKVKDEDTVLWASEAGMLRWLAGRNNIKLDVVMQPQPNVQLKYSMGAEETSTPEYIEHEVKDNYPIQPSGNWHQGGYGGHHQRALPQNDLTGRTLAANELGVNFSDTYEVYCHEFKPYSTTPGYGMAVCYMMEEPFIQVELRAMSREAVKAIEGNTFDVRLSDIDMPKGKPWEAVGIAKKCGNAGKSHVNKEKYEYVGPDSTLVTRAQMAEAVKDGCYFCNGGISIAEYDFTDFIEGQPICPDCIANNVSQELEA